MHSAPRTVSCALVSILSLGLVLGCTGDVPGDPEATDEGELAEAPLLATNDVHLRLVFVHGVAQPNDDSRRNAHRSFVDLEKKVLDGIHARLPELERSGRRLHVSSARVNLYTDENDALLSPSIDDLADGTGVRTATAWRSQLVKKTKKAIGSASG